MRKRRKRSRIKRSWRRKGWEEGGGGKRKGMGGGGGQRRGREGPGERAGRRFLFGIGRGGGGEGGQGVKGEGRGGAACWLPINLIIVKQIENGARKTTRNWLTLRNNCYRCTHREIEGEIDRQTHRDRHTETER